MNSNIINKPYMGVRNKMKKLLSIMLVFLVALSVMPLAKAQTSSLSFDEIEVEGTTVVQDNSVVDVAVVKDLTESSETYLPIRVRLITTVDIKDLKVSAWIGGYEYGVPRDTSEPFDITTYGTEAVKSVVLKLPLPRDLESSKGYKLNVEAFNNEVSLKKEIKLNVEGKRHLINLYDVVVSPGLSVDAGTPVIVKARVENLGDRVEEDIKVTAKVNLVDNSGNTVVVSDSDFVDELVPRSQEKGKDEVSSTSTDDLLLVIPKSARSGNYKLFIDVDFNRGTETVTSEYDFTVSGKETAASDVLVTASAPSKDVPRGSQVSFPVQVANLGKESRTFSLEVTGVKDWATTSVQPALLTVAPGSTAETYVLVSANEDVAAGTHVFAVKVSENGAVVKEVSLQGQVASLQDSTSEFKRGLEIVFLVLLAVLIILGIVVAIRKATMSGDEAEEAKGETYY